MEKGSIQDIKKGTHAVCVRRLINQGYSKEQAEIVCGHLISKTKDSNILEQIKKVGGTLAATGGGYYGIGRVANISLRKISSLIKTIKTKGGMKVGHAGLPPFLVERPMKTLHRLQTKLEQIETEEQKFLTAEQREQRAKYAITVKKSDADEIAEIIGKENMSYFDHESAFIYDQIEILTANTGLNNIIKAPVILARELVQEYIITGKDGSKRVEHHFKPFTELASAVKELDKIPMIIEHKESWDEEETIGYVKEFVADDKLRAIRGMGYFYENRLPQILLDALKTGIPVAVSIGFEAELGNSGIWNGLLYDFTQQNIILEHLAICLDSVPRCPIDLCGVNLKTDSTTNDKKLTIISKDNYYYNITKLLNDIEETRIKSKNSDNKIKSDSMIEDSENGPREFEVMLGRLKRFMEGESDLIKPDFAKKMISEILHMTDDKGEEKPSETQKGEDMDKQEFDDAIAKKDEDISKLQDNKDSLEKTVKEYLIREIQSFTDAETQKKLKLEDKCLHDLESIRDMKTIFKPVSEEPDVLPIESKEEKKKELEDAGAAPSSKKKYDTSEINAKINEEFEMTGFRISG